MDFIIIYLDVGYVVVELPPGRQVGQIFGSPIGLLILPGAAAGHNP